MKEGSMSLAENGDSLAAPSFIDGGRLYDFIVSGAGNIILNERSLNRINVFPVADGDTGTNLALTMRTIISKAVRNGSVGSTMDSISRIAVENAYGNSGMIFAQFLHGFADAVRQKEKLTLQEFAESSAHAVAFAYKAVAIPKEGTILTVMREWTEELKRFLSHDSLESWLDRSVRKANAIVEQTKSMMKVLRDNNVVDSGAKGFLLFVEGILAQVRHGGNTSSVLAMNVEEDDHDHVIRADEELAFRYCAQFVLQANQGTLDKDAVKAILENFGDSLVVTGGAPLLHVHLHTNEPERAMAVLLAECQVVSHKVDDMSLQMSISLHRKNRVGIVTDSIADVPASMLSDAQVVVIPVNVIHDGTAYLDKVTMTPRRFYEEIDTLSMHPTSAQPTLAAIERTFAFMLAHYDEVLGLFVSGKMSGLWHNAATVAQRLSENGKRIRVVDTRQNSAAEGLLVLEAIRLAGEGLALDALADRMEEMAAKSRIYVSVNTLKFMLKGGRISKAQGFILNLLKLKPVVSIDKEGKGTIWAKTFSRRQAISRILKKIRQDLSESGIRSYGLVYADDPSVLDSFRKQAESILGSPPRFVVPISSVVGLNAGRGAFAVAYVMEGK
jgi:uncharacterized protein